VKRLHRRVDKAVLQEVADAPPDQVLRKVANVVARAPKVACVKAAKALSENGPQRVENAVAVAPKVVKAESRGRPPKAESAVAVVLKVLHEKVVKAGPRAKLLKVVSAVDHVPREAWRPAKAVNARVDAVVRSTHMITTMMSRLT